MQKKLQPRGTEDKIWWREERKPLPLCRSKELFEKEILELLLKINGH